MGHNALYYKNVYNLKIFHMESKVVDRIIHMMNDKYGKDEPLTVKWGKVNDYLGMKINFLSEGNSVIHMDDYVNNILEEIKEDIVGTETTPTS